MSGVHETITIRAAKEWVFQAFVSEIDKWWPRRGSYRYTFAAAGMPPAHIAFEVRAGGRFYERLGDGTQFDIGYITMWDPPHRLAYTWQAPDWPSYTVVDVRFCEADGETKVTIRQSGFGERGVPDWSGNYATGLHEIMTSFAGWITERT